MKLVYLLGIYMAPKRPGLFKANLKQIQMDTSVETENFNIYMKMQKA